MIPHAFQRLITHQRPHLVFALRGTVAVLVAVVAAAFYEISKPASSPLPLYTSIFSAEEMGWEGGGVPCPI